MNFKKAFLPPCWEPVIVLSVAVAVLAADTSGRQTRTASNETLVPLSSIRADQAGLQQRTVVLANGEPVGLMQEVVIDWRTGQPAFGLIKLFDNIHPDAGFTAVPWSRFKFGNDDVRTQVLVTKEQLRRAPKIETSDLGKASKWTEQMQQYYGAQGSDSGMSGMIRGSGSSRQSDRGSSDYVRAGDRGATIAVYVVGALVLGILAGRYFVHRRREDARSC